MKLKKAKDKLNYYKQLLIILDETGTPNDFAEALGTVLQELERYKRLAEMNLNDSEEFKENMCKHRCLLKTELDNSISKDVIREKIENNNNFIKETAEDKRHIYERSARRHENKVLEELLHKEDKQCLI